MNMKSPLIPNPKEHHLVEQAAMLRTLIQIIPDLIWLKDLDGVYLTCNHIFE